MSDKTKPGVTVSLDTIREIMCLVFTEDHHIIFHGSGMSYIEDSAGELEEEFNDDTELYRWCNEQ